MNNDEKLDLLLQKFDNIDKRISKIELIVENDISKKINVVADGVNLNTERLNELDRKITEILDNSEILKVFNELAETKNKK